MPWMPRPPRRPGPSMRASLVVMGVGLLIGIPSFVAVVVPVVRIAGAFSAHAYAVPGEVRLHLRHARYTVYERTGTRSGFGGISVDDNSPVSINASQVSVIAPDGSRLPVFNDDVRETIGRGSAVYTGAVEFHTPAAGTYDVRLATNRSTTVLIARSLGDVIRSVLPWIGTGAIGGMVLLTGGVMLIVGAVRRGRARRVMYPGWGPPPPDGPGPPYGPPPGQYQPHGPPPGPWQPPPG